MDASVRPPDAAPESEPLGTVPLRRSTVDLARLLASTLEPLTQAAQTLDVSLSIDAPASEVTAVVDPEKIAWAIATLVGNALRYVRRGTIRRPGGTIAVRIRRDEAQRVCIEVEDDGPGIPADKLAHLFERRPGMQHAVGLGLRLIHEIVAAHGGRVQVESNTDYGTHGTTVRVTLP